jgi:hypothetical protein
VLLTNRWPIGEVCMTHAFELAQELLNKIDQMSEALERQSDPVKKKHEQMILALDGANYFDFLLSKQVLLDLSEGEFAQLQKHSDLYLKIYRVSNHEVQTKIMKVKNSSLATLLADITQTEIIKQKKESIEIKMPLIDIAKKMLPLKIQSIVEEHHEFRFTAGLRDEIYIRLTHNHKDPISSWNRELTLSEKKEIQKLVWDLTSPYQDINTNEVRHCRIFVDRLLGVTPYHPKKPLPSIPVTPRTQDCLIILKNLCEKTAQQELFSPNTRRKKNQESITSLFFSPREWISPRTKKELTQAIFCNFLMGELNALINKNEAHNIDDLAVFLEKLAITDIMTENHEKYLEINTLVNHIKTELSTFFKIRPEALSEMLLDKFKAFKETCKNPEFHHELYDFDKIEAYIKPSLAHMSSKLIKEFCEALLQEFSEDKGTHLRVTLV